MSRASSQLTRQGLIDGGVAGPEEIEQHLANGAQGRLDLAQPPMITARGRKAWAAADAGPLEAPPFAAQPLGHQGAHAVVLDASRRPDARGPAHCRTV